MDKAEMTRRLKGKVLENLVKSVLDDLGLPFTHTCEMGYLNKKGVKYADHINHDCTIEDKNYICHKYSIDANMFYRQIDSRFEVGKKKILVISEPSWTEHAMALARINNVHIISLGMNPETHYVECYWKLRKEFIKLFTKLELYCDILYGKHKEFRYSDPVYGKEVEDLWILEEVLHNVEYLQAHMNMLRWKT